MRVPRQLWLCLPPLVMCLLDGGLTLAGQSASYWAGNYADLDEANRVGQVLLRVHPVAFGFGVLGWAVVFTLSVLRLSDHWAAVVAFVIAFSHSVGAAAWLSRHGWIGWLAAACCLAAASRLIAWSWRRARLSAVPNSDSSASQIGGDSCRPVAPSS